MKHKNALTIVQNQCNPDATRGAHLPDRGPTQAGMPSVYTPYEEIKSTPTTEIAPVAINAVAQVAILVLKIVTLGAVALNGGIDHQIQMSAKRRRWRQISQEAAADNYGRGAGQIVQQNVRKETSGQVTIVHNYFINQDK
jgi:hypothetical protein